MLDAKRKFRLQGALIEERVRHSDQKTVEIEAFEKLGDRAEDVYSGTDGPDFPEVTQRLEGTPSGAFEIDKVLFHEIEGSELGHDRGHGMKRTSIALSLETHHASAHTTA